MRASRFSSLLLRCVAPLALLSGAVPAAAHTPHAPHAAPVADAESAPAAPAYTPGKHYIPGDIVSHRGHLYMCQPFQGNCGQHPERYEPGHGTEWTHAWQMHKGCHGH